jgi:hypothetical protein
VDSPTLSTYSKFSKSLLQRSDSNDSVSADGDADGGTGNDSNLVLGKISSGEGSNRKLNTAGLGPIAEGKGPSYCRKIRKMRPNECRARCGVTENSVGKGHRKQFSDSTISADSGGSDDNLSQLPLCIQNLGAAGQELLNHVQQQCIIDMCNILHHGILVLKHGRSGKPKLRTLCCDESLSILYWRVVGQVVNDDRIATSVEAGGNFALPDKSPFHNSFMDHQKKVVARRRSSFSVFTKQDSRREVVLRDVIEVSNDGYTSTPFAFAALPDFSLYLCEYAVVYFL